MHFSDEDLIAYLLGDATQELSQQISQTLVKDDDLVGRLSHLRMMLGLIDSLGSVYEPPSDLVDLTLARIDQQQHQLESAEPLRPQLARMLAVERPPRRSSLWDSTVLTVCLAVLCCLALPALVRVRFESRKAQCAHNLKATGAELINYALSSPESRFPYVAIDGREAFAGVYAIYLQEAGADISPSRLQCASLQGFDATSSALQLRSIPSFSEIHQLAVDELNLWQRAIGGNYAYNLGVQERGVPHAPKCEGKSHFAILADAPIITAGPNGQSREQFIAHDGRGINIFYEDGRIAFVSSECFLQPTTELPLVKDNPFYNEQGLHEVGLHERDASLAPSHFPPLIK